MAAITSLLTMQQAFPPGLPPAPPNNNNNMPDWSSMDFNQFAKYHSTVDLGVFEIPLVNVNVHEGQRPRDEIWITDLLGKYADGIQPHANPGVAILNTEEVPLDEAGKPDPKQMQVSIISSQHRCTARMLMDEPEDRAAQQC
jgi:hypothetical protein